MRTSEDHSAKTLLAVMNTASAYFIVLPPIFIGLYHRQPSVGYLVCDSMPDAVMARITKALKIGHIELRAASIDRDDEQSDGLVLSGVAAATQNITGKQFRIQAGHTRPSSAWCD